MRYFATFVALVVFLLLAPIDVLRQGQFGGTLSGPIKKERTFFFVNYEGQRRAESPTFPQFVVNNIGVINAAKTALGLSPENLSILRTNDYHQLFGRSWLACSSRSRSLGLKSEIVGRARAHLNGATSQSGQRRQSDIYPRHRRPRLRQRDARPKPLLKRFRRQSYCYTDDTRRASS